VPRACTIRRARKDDAREIAKLFDIASDGLATYIWSKLQAPGEDILDVGEARYARENAIFSYQNCIMAERNREIAGMMHCYVESGPPDEARDSDPVLKPYLELELYGSLYISSIAIHENHRGLGIGTELLHWAFTLARKLGAGKVSLICFERNEGAMRLYTRLGFREVDRRAIVPHPSLHYRDGDALLMARDV
jgi:ribosomal protein S18 acetylase RimI-like enzyme